MGTWSASVPFQSPVLSGHVMSGLEAAVKLAVRPGVDAGPSNLQRTLGEYA